MIESFPKTVPFLFANMFPSVKKKANKPVSPYDIEAVPYVFVNFISFIHKSTPDISNSISVSGAITVEIIPLSYNVPSIEKDSITIAPNISIQFTSI